MAIEPTKPKTCSECGGTNIVSGIAVSYSPGSGEVGLSHKAMKVFTAHAPMFADLCSHCGTITRLYVRDTDKPWITS